MTELEDIKWTQFEEVKDQTIDIIKVIGVGGGGGNAVENMYKEGVYNVSFAVCNTDSQALEGNSVPVKIQLGPGLGAGGDPVKGRAYANEDMERINRLFSDNTQMVFITAGMGGGTGTGAGPVIAKAARDRGILTIGVVTIPFKFEQSRKINKALEGVAEMRGCVDSLLVINNERLRDIYTDYSLENAFQKADDLLTVAIRSVAEVITRKGIVNRDFEDVKAVTENGGSAIISEGIASGEHRVEKAMMNALKSPLMNNMDFSKAKRLLYIIYQGDESPLMTKELDYVTEFMNDLEKEVDVNWGLYRDETLGEEVKVSIIATGFDDDEEPEEPLVDEVSSARAARIQQLKDKYYGHKPEEAVVVQLKPTLEEDAEEPDKSVGEVPRPPFVEEEPLTDGGFEPEEEDEDEITESAKVALKEKWKGLMNKLEDFLKND